MHWFLVVRSAKKSSSKPLRGRAQACLSFRQHPKAMAGVRVVVKIMVPFWVLNVIWHLVFRDPEGDHDFDKHPCVPCIPIAYLARR